MSKNSPKSASVQRNPPVAPPNPVSSGTTGVRRSSGPSGRSSAPNVIGALLLDGPPQRRMTLRHVQKQRGLRQSSQTASDSTVNSSDLEKPVRQVRPNPRREDGRHESYASYSTVNSISSGRARREVWKNGGIPVIVVPDRRSSSKSRSSREPSLRSTSSRRSKRTMSLGSAPLDGPTKDYGPIAGKNARRGRAFSESDGSDERTIDYPPAIPARSSSLSAPTSRNTSRAGSLTAESVHARNMIHNQPAPQTQAGLQSPLELEQRPIFDPPQSQPSRTSQTSPVSQQRKSVAATSLDPADPPATLSPSPREEANDRFSALSVDHHDDSHSSRRYTARNTPFSAASIDTNGTAPELSEATAIHMYYHQNSSVLMVNHSAKPSDTSDATDRVRDLDVLERPNIIRTGPDGEVPITPPQPIFSLEDVDSPLRNPRVPPEPPTHPPAINFIPATPSGLTPADDKAVQLGNYFGATEESPPRRPSMVRRALSRRRHSVQYPPTSSKPPGFLTRTFSLSRNVDKSSNRTMRARGKPDMEGNSTYPQAEDTPAEENKLHPFWRPQWAGDDDDECDENCHCRDEEVYRYPPVDNRPRLPKRSLSARMKQTFAILPTRDDEYYTDDDGPDRRTIRRTPSGSLRVTRRKISTESLRRTRGQNGRPSTAPDGEPKGAFWRGNSVQRRRSVERQRRFSIGSKLEEIQNIPRRLSEKRREKRTQELRQKISGPREVRDGVGDVVRSGARAPLAGNGQI